MPLSHPQYYSGILDTVGRTPLVRLNRLYTVYQLKLYAKMEAFNPGGSIKDRLGKELIDDAVKKGNLKEGGTIIEPTAGNTGIGLALAAVGTSFKVKVCVIIVTSVMFFCNFICHNITSSMYLYLLFSHNVRAFLF